MFQLYSKIVATQANNKLSQAECEFKRDFQERNQQLKQCISGLEECVDKFVKNSRKLRKEVDILQAFPKSLQLAISFAQPKEIMPNLTGKRTPFYDCTKATFDVVWRKYLGDDFDLNSCVIENVYANYMKDDERLKNELKDAYTKAMHNDENLNWILDDTEQTCRITTKVDVEFFTGTLKNGFDLETLPEFLPILERDLQFVKVENFEVLPIDDERLNAWLSGKVQLVEKDFYNSLDALKETFKDYRDKFPRQNVYVIVKKSSAPSTSAPSTAQVYGVNDSPRSPSPERKRASPVTFDFGNSKKGKTSDGFPQGFSFGGETSKNLSSFNFGGETSKNSSSGFRF